MSSASVGPYTDNNELGDTSSLHEGRQTITDSQLLNSLVFHVFLATPSSWHRGRDNTLIQGLLEVAGLIISKGIATKQILIWFSIFRQL